MITKPTPGQSVSTPPAPNAEEEAAAPKVHYAGPEAPPRLEIVTDPQGGFVYILTDRETGQVVARFPRESVRPPASDRDPASP